MDNDTVTITYQSQQVKIIALASDWQVMYTNILFNEKLKFMAST